MAEIPVYLVAGFLDAGKTDFINGVLADGFAREDKTLLIRCEEGENEYDPKALANVTVVTVEDEEDLKCSQLKAWEKEYKPKQVLIEYNGMWSMEKLYREILPSNWILYQIMTIVEGGTFEVYAKNMGQLMMEKITNADMIIFNRCSPEVRDALRRRNLRMVNRQASIYLEMEDGSSEDYADESMCPFDLDQEVIDIPDDDYGVWYVDVMDHPERYNGKKVHMKLVACRSTQYPDTCCPGRFAMVCCANDVQFLGLLARGGGIEQYKTRDWIEVTALMGIAEHEAYRGEGPVMNILSVQPCEKPKNDVVSF